MCLYILQSTRCSTGWRFIYATDIILTFIQKEKKKYFLVFGNSTIETNLAKQILQLVCMQSPSTAFNLTFSKFH